MKYLWVLAIVFSESVFSMDCDDGEIDLNPGDVISADLLKDIMSRISGVSSGLSEDELNGVWNCTSFNKEADTKNGYAINEDGIGSSMTQDITFAKQDDSTFLVTYQNNLGQASYNTTTSNSCKGKLINGALFVMQQHDTGDCWNTGLYGMKKVSKSCFVWEVTNSFPLSSATTCKRKSPAPLAPIGLTATLASEVVNLSWTGNDDAINYVLKVKTSVTGPYVVAAAGLTLTSYTDTLTEGTKWFRVFAENAAGTSTGSNVVSVSVP